jgi:peptidyl-prolyl cis-trans isomerase C
MPMPSRLMRILRAPALHFAVAGALVFVAARSLEDGGSSAAASDARTITIDASRVRGLKRDYSLAYKANPSAAEVRALVDKAVSDEILFREGIALGFEQGDRAVAWRLVQKMRYLGEERHEDEAPEDLYERAIELGLHLSDPVVKQIIAEKVRLVVGYSERKASDADLEAWYASHPDEFSQAGRVTLRHVFFDRSRRGDDEARTSAEEAMQKAEGHGLDVEDSLGSDPFVMGRRLAGQGPNDLQKFFGPDFASQAISLPAGSWQGPIESTFGWHLVFVEERFEPRVPPLAEVRSRVEKSYLEARRDERVAKYIDELRRDYTIHVDEAAIQEKGIG